MTLLLNEAYQTLMDENLRTAYNTVHSYKQSLRGAGYKTFTGSPYSTWVGPDRPQGVFVVSAPTSKIGSSSVLQGKASSQYRDRFVWLVFSVSFSFTLHCISRFGNRHHLLWIVQADMMIHGLMMPAKSSKL